MWSQVGLRKHHWTKLVEVMEFQLSTFNPERWCCESAALNMPANLEHSAVATGLEKVVFIPIPKKDNAKECSSLVQFSSITQSCLTLCDSMDCSKPGFPVHHQLLEFAQTHVHWVGDTIQLSPPLLFPSLPTFNLFLHQGLFQWVSSSHQVARVLELQLQHQSFQWIFRTDLL